MSSIGRTAARDTRSPNNSCRFRALRWEHGAPQIRQKLVKNGLTWRHASVEINLTAYPGARNLKSPGTPGRLMLSGQSNFGSPCHFSDWLLAKQPATAVTPGPRLGRRGNRWGATGG